MANRRTPRTVRMAAPRARSGAAPPEVHRVTGPGELLQAVPYLLGFHPQDSLVLVGLRTGGRLVVTARLDLADVTGRSGAGLVAHTLESMCTGGAGEVIAAIYTSRRGRDHDELVVGMADVLDRLGAGLGDVLLGDGKRWWSLSCAEPECCDPAGMPMPDAGSSYVMAATVEGVVPLTDRGALVALLQPGSDADRDALLPLIERARRSPPGNGALKRALFAAARAADAARWTPPDDAAAVTLGVALRTIALRDSLWLAVDERRIDGRELWRDLARRLPAPYDSAPAFLYGWASWRHGNGALARIAAERAVASDPAASAADLLLAALANGLDPHTFPRLRRPA